MYLTERYNVPILRHSMIQYTLFDKGEDDKYVPFYVRHIL
jgi:hypothetical protein